MIDRSHGIAAAAVYLNRHYHDYRQFAKNMIHLILGAILGVGYTLLFILKV